jgi:hypothetical protein
MGPSITATLMALLLRRGAAGLGITTIRQRRGRYVIGCMAANGNTREALLKARARSARSPG